MRKAKCNGSIGVDRKPQGGSQNYDTIMVKIAPFLRTREIKYG